MSTSPTWIPFGRLTRPHGVRGELRLVPHHAGDVWPKKVEQVRLVPPKGEPVVVTVVRARPAHDVFLVTLEGVTDRDAAARWAATELSLSIEDLPPLDAGEFFLHELLGLRVEDEAGVELGQVRSIRDNRGQDLMVIGGRGGERFLPVIDGTVVEVDRDGGRVVVAVPPGLWDAE